MPLLPKSTYTPFPLLKNPHVQTIYPAILRSVRGVTYQRERLELKDGDFIDLDWLKMSSDRLVILLHGLEGSASRGYIKGMARTFHSNGWDVLAMNFRGCSGEPNRLLRSYHAGATDDLREVLRHATTAGEYRHMGMVGFSLGGNLLLKYLGEEGAGRSRKIVGAVAFSVPCDLASSVEVMSKSANRWYMMNFLKQLKKKLEQKQERYPDEIDLTAYDDITSFYEFDDRYTAPIHGFRDADEYWSVNSCKAFLPKIGTPTLIVNAGDDPFLGEACYPFDASRNNPWLSLEVPEYGGHVGFVSINRDRRYWSEARALRFLSSLS